MQCFLDYKPRDKVCEKKRNLLLHVIKSKIKLGYNTEIEIMIIEFPTKTLY